MGPRQTFDRAAQLKGAQNSATLQQVDLVDRWLAAVVDPQFANAGQAFLDRVDQCDLSVDIDPSLTCIASYCSFSLSKTQPGLINAITYGHGALNHPTKLYNAAVHESIHSLQMHESIALHASPFNAVGGNKIIVCPRDWLLLETRCEQDAYAKQAWLNRLLADTHPGAWNSGQKGPLSAHDFQRYRDQRGGDLTEGLKLAAAHALDKSYWMDNPHSTYRFANYVQDCALRNYRAAMNIRQARGEQGFIFVQLRPEHIHDIGKSFGPNSFGDNPHDRRLLQKKPLFSLAENTDLAMGTKNHQSTRALFAELKNTLRIGNENALPYLDEVLLQHQITPAQFMACAKTPANTAQTPRPPGPSGP